MSEPVEFVGGDDLIEPFQLQATDGSILDLAIVTLTGGIWWRGRKQLDLDVGNELEIVSQLPTGDDPHGYIHLSEAQTLLLPMGRIAGFRLTVVDADGVTQSTMLYPMTRLP